MKLLSENLCLDQKFFALRRHRAENDGGFVCILDLRRPHRDSSVFSPGQVLALLVLISFVVLMVNCWLASFSEPAPQRDGDTAQIREPGTQIIESEAPPDFSPDTVLPPAPPN